MKKIENWASRKVEPFLLEKGMSINKTKLEELIEKMKAEAKELGLDLEERLDAAKAEWAETAATDPDTARRQLRAFWGVVGMIAGIIIGGCAVHFFG